MSGKPIVFANVWDGASAKTIATLSATKAVATASYAIAATHGLEDEELSLTENLGSLRTVVTGLKKAGKFDEIPLSADLQDGYEDPAETVRKAISLGVVGCNLEDCDIKKKTMFEVDVAVMRIEAAHKAAVHAGVPDFVINARTDILGYGGNIKDVIERGNRYLKAGATTVFVWGVLKWDIKEEEVKEMVEAFGGKLAVQPGSIGAEKLKELGVSRISVGPVLWMQCMSGLVKAAEDMKLL